MRSVAEALGRWGVKPWQTQAAVMFLFAKIADLLAQPLHWVVALLLLDLLILRRGTRRRAQAAATALLLLCGIQALPDIGLRALESEYAEIAPQQDLVGYAGVIILGGALEPAFVNDGHTQPALNGAGERMSAAVALWQHQPDLTLLFTGGEGELFSSGPAEALRAEHFFASQGLPASAVRYESASRNTRENAEFSARLPGIDPTRRWLLLTSAWHMPRAMRQFRRAGWNVSAYPVDYRTSDHTPWWRYSIHTGAEHWALLLHEYLGLAQLTLTGR